MKGSTRATLDTFAGNLEESMGVRLAELRPKLSPVANRKDSGRKPIRNVGKIDINNVIPDPEQPRIEFSQEAIERLSQSIRDKGQLSPIRVRWSDEYEKWIIISGERRWRATKLAELPTIDCYFHEADITRSEILEEQLIENCLREDLSPIEQARAFSRLMDLNGWTGKQIAEALRIEPATVSRALALLRLPNDIQEQVEEGQISARAGYELSKLENEDLQRKLADQATETKLTHTQTAKAVRERRGKPAQQSRFTRENIVTPEGWRIVISARKKGTYFEIEQALEYALEEVRHRIKNNVQIF